MEKKGARPHARRQASATRPRGAGASKRPARPSRSWGELSCPSPLCSFLHGLLRSCSAPPDATAAAARLPFPPLASPFPRIRVGAGSAPGARQGRRASSGLSPLSLHPLCPSGLADRARCNVPCGVCAADGPPPTHFWTLLSLVIVPRAPRSPSAPPSTSPRPLPSLKPQPPGLRAGSSRPRYSVSLLSCKGRAWLSDLCCSVWCRV